MDDKDKKAIAEIVASALDSRASTMEAKARLEPHDRHVTARECDVKHGQIMTTLRAQTGKMEAVHNGVQRMQGQIADTTSKINGHVSWHNGVKEEKSDATIKKRDKWTAAGTVAKWAALIVAVLGLTGSCAWGLLKVNSLAENVAMMNGEKNGTSPTPKTP